MVKMTEKQFRETLIRSGMVPSREYTSLLDCVVLVAVEAGLEFAPEPVRLPERLELWTGRSPTTPRLARGERTGG